MSQRKKKLPLGDTELDLTGTDEQTEVALQAGCLQPMGLLATDPKKIIRPARLRTLGFLWLDELVDECFSRSTVSLIERRRIIIENLKVRRPCGCSRTSRPATTARSSRSLISFPRASDHLSFRLRLTSFRVFLGYSPLAFSVIFSESWRVSANGIQDSTHCSTTSHSRAERMTGGGWCM